MSRGRLQAPCNGAESRVQLGVHSLSVAATPPVRGALSSRSITKGKRGGAKLPSHDHTVCVGADALPASFCTWWLKVSERSSFIPR